MLEGLDKILLGISLWLTLKESNDQVAYEALIARISLAAKLGVKTLLVQSDSQLVVGQVHAEFRNLNRN